MKNFYLKFFAIIGIFATFCILAFGVGIACAKETGAEDSVEADVNPVVAHYKTQYESLQMENEKLSRENEYLKIQIECDANNIELLEDAIRRYQYDVDRDGVVTMSDAVKLIKVITETE